MRPQCMSSGRMGVSFLGYSFPPPCETNPPPAILTQTEKQQQNRENQRNTELGIKKKTERNRAQKQGTGTEFEVHILREIVILNDDGRREGGGDFNRKKGFQIGDYYDNQNPLMTWRAIN